MKEIYDMYLKHDVNRHSAALSYYVFVGISSMFVVIASVLGLFTKYDTGTQQIIEVATYFFNYELAIILKEVLSTQPSILGAGIFGGIVLIVTSTAALTYLQDSLNEIMDGERTRGVKKFFKRRLISLGILLFSSLVVVLLIMSATIIANLIADDILISLSYVIQALITIIFLTLMYKYLPSKKRSFKLVLKGSVVTGSILIFGKILLDSYLGFFGFNTLYGIASYSILSLLWLYFSMNVVLIGAILIALDTPGQSVYK